jgi:hypothetical protein
MDDGELGWKDQEVLKNNDKKLVRFLNQINPGP